MFGYEVITLQMSGTTIGVAGAIGVAGVAGILHDDLQRRTSAFAS